MKYALTLILAFFFIACSPKKEAENKKQLLVYCGITMVKPMSEIKKRFEESHPTVEVLVVQGGSQDLYNSLKLSRKGDLYLPGSLSYREKNIGDGLLGDTAFLGYNQAAIVVVKGNPLGFSDDLNELVTTNHSVVLCNPASGSIGRMTQKILQKAEIEQEVMDNTAFLTTDSRNLTKALVDGTGDVVINWKATAYWPENRDKVEVIELPEKLAPKKELVLNTLTFSKEPELANAFLTLAGSQTGRDIFKSFGF